MFMTDVSEEEYRKLWYEVNVTGPMKGKDKGEYSWSGMSKRKYIITEAACAGYIDMMANDANLNLSEKELQYARRCLFMTLWENEREDLTDEEMKQEDLSDIFQEYNLMDLYSNREKIFGDELWR